jgi:hypothetical protein
MVKVLITEFISSLPSSVKERTSQSPSRVLETRTMGSQEVVEKATKVRRIQVDRVERRFI